MTCEHCGRHNHEKSECYFYKRMIQQEERSGNLKPVQKNIARADGFAFMVGQPHPTRSTRSDEILFLLDSGATDHITNREDVFACCHTLPSPIKISVAKTGHSITAIKRGTIQVVTNLGM